MQTDVPELDRAFFNALTDQLQKKQRLAAMVGAHARSADYGANITHLQNLVEAAVEGEQSIKDIIQIASPRYGRNAIGGGSHMATTDGTTLLATGDQEAVGAPHDLQAIRGTIPMHSPVRAPPPQTQASNGIDAMVLLSNAEAALRKSSGTNAPNQCWGCGGPHVFRDCPRKNEPEVQEQFKKGLQEFLDKKEERRRTPFEPNHYKRDGFPTKKSVALFNAATLADSAQARQLALSALKAEMDQHEADQNPSPMKTRAGRAEQAEIIDPSRLDRGLIMTFFPLPGQSTQSIATLNEVMNKSTWASTFINSPLQEISFPVAQELPHIVMPIGRQKERYIEGLLDTGGACNMGDILVVYWDEVTKRHPETVHQYEKLEDHRIEPIKIGGVGAGCVVITHIVCFRMPWTVEGKPTFLTIGLGDAMPLTLIIGFPFHTATDLVVDHGNNRCYSPKLGQHWVTTVKAPCKKTLRSLGSTANSPGKRHALTTLPALEDHPNKRSCLVPLGPGQDPMQE